MKKFSTLLILLITVNAFSQTNLVPNFDFEGDVVGESATGWTNSGADSREVIAPGQESSLAFQVSGAINKGAQYITDGTTELPIASYVISFWAKGMQGESAKFKVKFNDATTKTVVGTAFKATGVWEYFELSFSTSEVLYVDKYLLQCNSANQTFVADNLFFGEGEGAPIEAVDPEFTSFPFNQNFSAGSYLTGTTIASFDGTTENDSWAIGGEIFDRMWRGTNTLAYTCVVDEDAYDGATALKFDITNKNGADFRLRTVNIPVGSYSISFYAKTDVAGEGDAKVGFLADESTWSTLTTNYQKYTGVGTVTASESNGSTRLIVFYTSGISQLDNVRYNIWIDKLVIEESSATGMEDALTPELGLYPNPVSSQLFIQSDNDVEKVEVFNMAGVKVKEYLNVVSGINVSDLASGLYVVTVTSNGKKVTKKINKK